MSSKQSTGIFRLFLFLSLLALVVGCSGGSSDDAPNFANRMITAFSFTAEVNPQLGGDITGTIDEANSTILLAGPLESDAVASLKASFTTTGKEVSVEGDVQESGVTENDFAGPLTYRVTAEDGTTRDYLVHAAYWKHPSDPADGISPDGVARYPQVAMDGSGNAVIVWDQYDGSYTYKIFKSEYRDGTWSTPASISPTGAGAGNAEYPQVAMDDSGNAVVVWDQFDNVEGVFRIFMSEYRGGAWSDPASINPAGDGAGDADYPQVAMDGSGNAVIVWGQSGGIFKSEYRFWD